jgi:hypothetical protein
VRDSVAADAVEAAVEGADPQRPFAVQIQRGDAERAAVEFRRLERDEAPLNQAFGMLLSRYAAAPARIAR